MISTSPQRHTFQKENYIKNRINSGRSMTDEIAVTMIAWYDSITLKELENESDPEWRKYNLEYDLRTTDWILRKVRSSEIYSQNLYAALCNNKFARTDDCFRILKEDYWSCSFRRAGGIIAHMRQTGDYIDWYLSDNLPDALTMPVGFVTDEIRQNLEHLGWIVIRSEYD